MSSRVLMRRSIISCCLIFLVSGCETNQQNIGGDEQSSKKAKAEHKEEIVVGTDDSGKIFVPSTPVAPGPTSVSVPPAPTPLGNGTGGGSQGALKPIDLGNEDDGEEEIPKAVCGNGKQEAYAGDYHCPFDMYGVTITDMSGTSNLIGFFFDRDGQGGPIGTINDFHNVTDVDFSPDGTLFGVADDNNGNLVLITIDCKTAQASLVGLLNVVTIDPDPKATDISFDSFGRLWAYVVENGTQRVGVVNPSTGQFSALFNPTGLTDVGNGLGSAPFPNDGLYEAGNAYLSTIDRSIGSGGAGTNVYPLTFTAPAVNSPFINGLDVDPLTELFYASIQNGSDYYVGSVDLSSGNVGFIVNPPYTAPVGLQGIAVNRSYEECDPLSGDPALPSGTDCTEECQFIESDCADGIDNDQDGVADCVDPDCFAQTCNDGNSCTVNDACLGIVCANDEPCYGVCTPGPLPDDCSDGNECTVDSCTPNGENYTCNNNFDTSKTSWGSCGSSDDDDDDPCILGRCVDITNTSSDIWQDSIYCETANKNTILVADGGCDDGLQCTADICESEENGSCEYGLLDGTSCLGGYCDQGQCVMVP